MPLADPRLRGAAEALCRPRKQRIALRLTNAYQELHKVASRRRNATYMAETQPLVQLHARTHARRVQLHARADARRVPRRGRA